MVENGLKTYKSFPISANAGSQTSVLHHNGTFHVMSFENIFIEEMYIEMYVYMSM